MDIKNSDEDEKNNNCNLLGKRTTSEKSNIKGCGHKLLKVGKSKEEMEVYCDNCNATKINLKKEYWHCGACDFDLCSACYTKKTQPNLFSAFAGSSSKKQKLNPEEEEKSELQSVGDTLFNVGQS